MNKADLKKLAHLAAAEKALDASFSAVLSKRLSRAELKDFLFYLRRALKERKVMVRAASSADDTLRAQITRLFPDKDAQFETVPELGGGLQVEYEDTIVDVSVNNMVARAFTRIKESL